MKTRIVGALVIALLLISFMAILTMAQPSSEPHSADAMWVEPASVYFTDANATVGTKFNVTVAMNMTENVFSYSIGMHYNRTQLNATRGGFTAKPTSNYFTGHSTTTGMVIDTSYLGNGSVLATETCSGDDYIPGPNSGTLIWVEFKILQIPPSGTWTSVFNITKDYPGDTFVADENVNVLAITTYDAVYAFQGSGPLPPAALSVTISPSSASVSVSQSLLFTSNVTGGTPAYSYQWFLNGTAILGATSDSWTFSSMTNDTYTVYLNVTDSLGTTVKSNIASVTVVLRLLGDIDGDGKVTGLDVAKAAWAFGSYPGSDRWNQDADIDGDDRVDGRDLVKIALNFGEFLNP